jgi:L,D-transpeptidase catalytic domain
MQRIAACLVAAILLCAFARAEAAVVVTVDKTAQRLTVVVDGVTRYRWPVSTARWGYRTPNGSYRPQRLARTWFSRKYDMSPMPHSIFFDEGIAIHGTHYVSRLGAVASHGCVRLAPANAATLFKLVQSRGMAATTIVVTHSGWPDLAKLAPKPESKPELKLQAAPQETPEAKAQAKPDVKPAAEAPVKANLPAAAPPKPSAAIPVAAPAVATARKPDRVLMERVVDTPPGTVGALATQPAEPPSLASAGSEPVKLPAQQR